MKVLRLDAGSAIGLNHIAMSRPEWNAVADEFCAEFRQFYGESARLAVERSGRCAGADRLTISVGPAQLPRTFVSDRTSMVCHGYEHFGIVVAIAPTMPSSSGPRLDAEPARSAPRIAVDGLTTAIESVPLPLPRLPFAVEIQHFP